jgi:4-amino-4-deoxy-L-arabinose transferase-like glycosyltransferase
LRKCDILNLAFVLLISLAARLTWLTDDFNVNEPDELLHLTIAENFADGALYPRYDPGGYLDGFWPVPSLPLCAAGTLFRITGSSLWTFRLLTALVGVAGVAAFWAFSGLYLRGLGHWVAVVLFALSPLSVYGSTLAMLGYYAVLFMLLSLWMYARHILDGRRLDLVLAAVFLAATCASKHYGPLLGGLYVVHWTCLRWKTGAPPLRRLAALLGVTVAAFLLLQPWALWRPYDFAHGYLYRMFLSHIVALLRGHHRTGSLFALPYAPIVFAHGFVGAIGLAAFMLTWRRKWDIAAFYALLLALPILVFRETRYLGISLPAVCLFAGYLVSLTAGMTRGRSWLVRTSNLSLVALLGASVMLTAFAPPRVRSGLVDACDYVRTHSNASDRVLSNYWRPAIRRFTTRTVPADWLDATGRPLVERGEIAYVILDGSPYTRHVITTPEREAAAAWVKETFPRVWASPDGVFPTEVYATGSPGSP